MAAPSGETHTTNPTIFMRLNSEETRPREIAWGEFRDHYAPIISGFARRLGARPQDVDDVVQDVLLGFFSTSPTFVYDPAKGRFRGYLKTCTFHALHKRLGREIKFKAASLDQVDPGALEVDQAWNDVWEQQLLRRALDAVREDCRGENTFRAFEQYVILAKDVDQVATELGVSVDVVYKAKQRVTEAVRKKLRSLREDEG